VPKSPDGGEAYAECQGSSRAKGKAVGTAVTFSAAKTAGGQSEVPASPPDPEVPPVLQRCILQEAVITVSAQAVARGAGEMSVQLEDALGAAVVRVEAMSSGVYGDPVTFAKMLNVTSMIRIGAQRLDHRCACIWFLASLRCSVFLAGFIAPNVRYWVVLACFPALMHTQ
jgi:hypothetical protein